MTTWRRALASRGLWTVGGLAVGGAVGLLVGLHVSGNFTPIWVTSVTASVALLVTAATFVFNYRSRQQDVQYRDGKDQRDADDRADAQRKEAGSIAAASSPRLRRSR